MLLTLSHGAFSGRGQDCFFLLATLRNQLSRLELSSESHPSRTIAGHGDLRTFPLPFLYTFFFQRQGRLMVSRLRPFVLLLLACALLGAACSKAPGRNDSSLSPSGARPTIVFMTDFGTANDAVAICKAVMVGIAPAARIMDITHQVTPYSIEEAARFLESVSPYYPAGTVFVAVVDPGVGTSRKAIIVKSKKGQFFVLPDNGLITPVMDRDGLDSAREITNPNWMIQSAISSTFHGRDIFSPAAAHLAAGWDFNLVGPEVPQLVRLTPKTSATTDKGI